MKRLRLPLLVAVLAFAPLAFAPPKVSAQRRDTGMLSYSLQGLGTGAAVGLAAGYLTTGPTFESGEWRRLVFGAGVGALAGLGAGVILGVADSGHRDRRHHPGIVYYVMRDMNYGLALGALGGGIVGALRWVDHGRSKNVLTGAAWGTLIGAGVGFGLGLIESSIDSGRDRYSSRRVRVDLAFMPTPRGLPVPYPSVSGRF